MRRSLFRISLIAAVLLPIAACSGIQDPSGAESWAADLIIRQQILFMRVTRAGDELTGTGSLSDLAAPVGEPLTLTGIRYGDTVDIVYRRQSANSFRFIGWYTSRGTLAGTLDGAEFVRVSVDFKNR